MSKGIFKKLFPIRKPFSAWQIELTTRCPLRCRMCIREGFKDWRTGDMSMADFKRLMPHFKDVETVILEGWGESLLQKNLIEAIRLVKGEGSQVGFVTSGKGLNKDYISELINAGVDFIGFSLSGATPGTHNSIRVNSDLQTLLSDIKGFNEIKKNKKIENPRLHIVYLMLKDNIFEVPVMLELAKEIGIKEVVLINLTHVTNEWQEKQRVFRCNELEDKSRMQHEEILKEAEIKARELKIKLRLPSLSPYEAPVCEENPLRNLYISVDGEVSPCVYLYPPTGSPFKRVFCGEEYQVEKLSFGNIFKEPFHTIWDNKGYTEFRGRFTLRKRRFEEMYYSDLDRLKRFEIVPLPEPPEQCKTCHKMLGL